MAEACDVKQARVSSWERGKDNPNPSAVVALAKLVSKEEAQWWLSQAGLFSTQVINITASEANLRYIPVITDPAAAGTPRATDEKLIDFRVAIPKQWLPTGGSIVGLRVSGDSMAPIIGDGYLVLIDTLQRDPEKLVDCMVAVREDSIVTIKWLRRDAAVFMLVPNLPSEDIPVRILHKEGDFSIVGAVVKWIGFPPETRAAVVMRRRRERQRLSGRRVA